MNIKDVALVTLFILLATTILYLNDITEYYSKQYDELTAKIQNLSMTKSNLEYEIFELNKTINYLNEQIEKRDKIINSYKKYGLIRKQISYNELISFLLNDPTNRRPYTDNHTCVDFASEMVRNAYENNIFMCHVYLEFKNDDTGHVIVAVNTIDKGILYIEPQSDTIITDLKIGDDYCKKVYWNCNRIIEKISSCFN